MVKVNVDALYREGGGADFGMVARNFRCEVLMTAVSQLAHALSAVLAEAQGSRGPWSWLGSLDSGRFASRLIVCSCTMLGGASLRVFLICILF